MLGNKHKINKSAGYARNNKSCGGPGIEQYCCFSYVNAAILKYQKK
jgi:hypothetical protein